MAAIKLYRGVTYPSQYQHTDGNGANLPLTDCTVFFTVKPAEYDENTTDTTAVFKATITAHDDAANGLTSWDTLIPRTGVEPGDGYFCDIVVQDVNGKQLPPVYLGAVSILGKPTNRIA